jgi:hypothetical protein
MLLAPATIAALEKLSLVSQIAPKPFELKDVNPDHIYMMKPQTGDVFPDPSVTFELGDYVAVVRAGVAVPPGLHGVVLYCRSCTHFGSQALWLL